MRASANLITAVVPGTRILVVEDEIMIAMLLEEILSDAGYTVVGPYSRLADALVAAQTLPCEAALLDVNLGGEKVFPAAEALEHRHVPFLLLSGYGDKAIPSDHPNWHSLEKPFKERELLMAIAGMVVPVAPVTH